MAGRPRKPTKVHELSGAYKRNPQRRPKNEPQPEGKFDPEPPRHLMHLEKECWRQLVAAIPPQVATTADTMLIEQTSILMAMSRIGSVVPMKSSDRGLLLRCLSQLGCTPVDRSKIIVPDAPKGENAFSRYCK